MTRTNYINLLFFFTLFLAFFMISKIEANQLDTLNEEINKNPKNYQAHFRLAGELLKLKDYQGAAKKYQFLIDENKNLRLPTITPFSSSNEFEKALLRYVSLEKFKSTDPLTLTFFIVNTFSSPKLLVDKINRIIVNIKKK